MYQLESSRWKLSSCKITARTKSLSGIKQLLATLVQDKHQSGSNATESIGDKALVDTCCNSLFSGDLFEAVQGAVVDVLLLGQLSLHLQTTTDCVEWVADTCTENDGSLCGGKGGDNTQDTVVILERVQAHQSVEGSQLESTVWDDTSQGDTEACIETGESQRSLCCLDQAITKTTESLLSTANIGCQTSSCIIQRIHNAQTSCSGSTS